LLFWFSLFLFSPLFCPFLLLASFHTFISSELSDSSSSVLASSLFFSAFSFFFYCFFCRALSLPMIASFKNSLEKK
jgi:hypothetical protein